jgi:hypothetical protein
MNGFGEKEARETADRAKEARERAVERASDIAGSVSQAGEVIQELARDVGTQASQAATSLYQQGTTAGGYLSRFAAEQPVTALILAAALGYGLGYLIHRSD